MSLTFLGGNCSRQGTAVLGWGWREEKITSSVVNVSVTADKQNKMLLRGNWVYNSGVQRYLG